MLRGISTNQDFCNFFRIAGFYGLSRRENEMNGSLIRAGGRTIDGWPILLAFAMYLIAFGIFAMMADLRIAVV